MSNLWMTDEEFAEDVAALQAAYQQRCEVTDLKTNTGDFCTAAATGARTDWAFNPANVSK